VLFLLEFLYTNTVAWPPTLVPVFKIELIPPLECFVSAKAMEVHTQSVNVSRKGVSFVAKHPLALNTVVCIRLILFYSRGIRPSKISFNKEGALT